MRQNNVELRVRIKGTKVAFEYTSPKDLLNYIEGRDGSEFEIEVINHNHFRIEAIVSVDGLSVIDGKEAGDDSRGYVLDRFGRITIPGWKVDSSTVAKFQFSGRKGGSYVERSTGQATNKGVIGLMVYKERVSAGNKGISGIPYNGYPPYSNPPTSAWPNAGPPHYWSDNFGVTGGGVIGGVARGMYMNAVSATTVAASASAAASSSTMNTGASTPDSTVPKQTLGTEFGEAETFITSKITFTRADLLVMMALYYDDRRGLAKRGIEVVRESTRRYQTTPNPFPNSTIVTDGCVPPEGWNR
jgi:hypothetical protein